MFLTPQRLEGIVAELLGQIPTKSDVGRGHVPEALMGRGRQRD